MSKKLYLAYGSNLNLEQMACRCPAAKPAGTSELKDYRLLFRGAYGGAVATVEPCEGKSVPVLLWEITPADEAALDRYEGFPYLYRKETVKVKHGGKTVSATVYIMNDGRDINLPGRYYYNIIRQGYLDCGFNTGILAEALNHSVEKAANPNRHFSKNMKCKTTQFHVCIFVRFMTKLYLI